MSRKIENIRNIGIIAHIDAGKTTVTEKMLFLSGAVHRAGGVDQGTATTDDDDEERERGITIYSACVTFDWADSHINLLDTPGHVDFTAEVERCLRVLDGAVVVFSAREGVEAQSETVWRQANKYKVPRIAYINKLDREGASFERVFEEIGDRLEAHPVAIQIPYGQGPSHVDNPLRGVIDLIEMKLLKYEGGGQSREFETVDIPEDALDEAQFWRERLVETLYDHSNEMMELALAEEEIPAELIRQTLRKAALEMKIQPLLCGSALHGVGVQPLLDAVGYYLPSPLERPPVEGIEPGKVDKKTNEPAPTSRKPSPKEPFCGLVFKILPQRTGDLYWIRVYSGELKQNSRMLCPGKEKSDDKKENIAQLWQIFATRKDPQGQVDKVSTGDIVLAIGPRHAVTGDTLCDTKAPILLESIEFPETVISMAIEPESTGDRKKLADTLDMLRRQDPTFRARENEETGQTLISGMGELHLEVIKHRLLRDYKLDVKVHKPRVSYRETVQQAAEVTGECHRMVAGQQLFAKVRIKMEPFEQGQKAVTVLNRCPPDTLPPELIQVVMEQLRSKGEGGGVSSFPLTQLKVTFLGGEMAEEGSNDMAFNIAANEAFEEAMQKAKPALLEPYMKLSILTPEEYYGEFVNDIQRRRGIIARTEQKGDTTMLEAHAPLMELFGYSGAMRSLSNGRAGTSLEPLNYQQAPPEVGKEYGL